MAGILTTGTLSNQYDKAIDKMVMMAYTDYPNEYPQIFDVGSAALGRTYVEAELTGLGGMRELGEGEPVDYDIPAEGHKKSRSYIKYGRGFQLTEESEADDVHGKIPSIAKTLARGANARIDLSCFHVLNLGDTAEASGGEEGWDGLPLFSDSHVTLKSGDTIDNKGTASLSETGLQAAFEYFDSVVSEEGFPLMLKGSRLLVGPKLRWLANRLARQRGGITDGTNSTGMTAPVDGNDMTTNPSNGYVNPWKLMILRYLGAQFGGADDAWFFLSDMADLRLRWKWKPRMEAGNDMATGNRLYRLTMRFQAFSNDYKGMYGSFPT